MCEVTWDTWRICERSSDANRMKASCEALLSLVCSLPLSASLDCFSLFRWCHTALAQVRTHPIFTRMFHVSSRCVSLWLTSPFTSSSSSPSLWSPCGGPIPCALPLRTLAPWPITSVLWEDRQPVGKVDHQVQGWSHVSQSAARLSDCDETEDQGSGLHEKARSAVKNNFYTVLFAVRSWDNASWGMSITLQVSSVDMDTTEGKKIELVVDRQSSAGAHQSKHTLHKVLMHVVTEIRVEISLPFRAV